MRGLLFFPACFLLACAPSEAPTREQPADIETSSEWKPLSNEEMGRLAAKDPVAFLQECVHRYHHDKITGYRLTFQKKERIAGKEHPTEIIDVSFREKPHSVFFRWKEGARRAAAALYVEGENDNMMLVHPAGVSGRLVKVVKKDPEGEEARQSGRYSLKDFGLKNATLRALETWKKARDDGALHVEVLPEQKVKEAGGKTCWVLRRSGYAKPENDGVAETTLYIDKDTWFQVGSVVKDQDGRLIGEYYFRDIKLNPEFKEGQFTEAAIAEVDPRRR